MKTKTNWAPDAFETFWMMYPVKVGKSTAMKAWDKLKLPKPEIAKMMWQLEIAKASAPWNDLVHIPHAATWLNHKQWIQ